MTTDESTRRPARPRVIIAGAGFGGLWTAKALRDAPVDVLVVDRHDYHTFMPFLYQVAAAELGPDQPIVPVRSILRELPNAEFILGRVTQVDPSSKLLQIDDRWLAYDYLVLATGSRANFFGISGAADHALPIRSLGQASRLRNRLLRNYEQATQETDPVTRRALLTTVVAGGGPAGVEFAGALAELINAPLRKDFPSLGEELGHIVLVEAADRLLGAFSERSSRYAAKRLRRMGVEVRTGTLVSSVSSDRVELDDGSAIATKTVVWTAGVRAEGLPERSGLPTNDSGQVITDDALRVPGCADVFAVGDIAAQEEGRDQPLLAQVAMQGGVHVAETIAAGLEGRTTTSFAYNDKGKMAVVGRNAAVAETHRLSITGFIAWIAWATVHIYQLIGFRNRLVVLVNWAWDYVFFERAVRVILPDGERDHDEEAPHPQAVAADAVDGRGSPSE